MPPNDARPPPAWLYAYGISANIRRRPVFVTVALMDPERWMKSSRRTFCRESVWFLFAHVPTRSEMSFVSVVSNNGARDILIVLIEYDPPFEMVSSRLFFLFLVAHSSSFPLYCRCCCFGLNKRRPSSLPRFSFHLYFSRDYCRLVWLINPWNRPISKRRGPLSQRGKWEGLSFFLCLDFFLRPSMAIRWGWNHVWWSHQLM